MKKNPPTCFTYFNRRVLQLPPPCQVHCTLTIPKLFNMSALRCVVHGYCVSDHCVCVWGGGEGLWRGGGAGCVLDRRDGDM